MESFNEEDGANAEESYAGEDGPVREEFGESLCAEFVEDLCDSSAYGAENDEDDASSVLPHFCCIECE